MVFLLGFFFLFCGVLNIEVAFLVESLNLTPLYVCFGNVFN